MQLNNKRTYWQRENLKIIPWSNGTLLNVQRIDTEWPQFYCLTCLTKNCNQLKLEMAAVKTGCQSSP